MTVEQRKLEKDLCRCCHAEGSFKNLGISWYNPLGEEEIYSNMLREQLGLDIYPVSGLLSEVTYKICDPCIVRLRDATDFRKQVQTCEAKFSDLISKNVFQVAVPFVADVKVEMEEDIFEGMKAEDDDADDGFEPTNFDDDEDNKDEVQTLLQLKQETKKGKGKGKATAKTKAKPVAAKAKKATAKATKAKKAIKEETDAMIMELPAASGEAEKKKKGECKKKSVSSDHYKIVKEDGQTKFYCNICGSQRRDFCSLKCHVINMHLCTYCDAVTPTKYLLTEHLKLGHGHVKEKLEVTTSETFKCEVCSKEFQRKKCYQDHIRRAHKLPTCKQCDITFEIKGLLLNHQHEKHGLQKHKCGVCEFESFSKVYILDHQRRVHMKEKNLKCEICGTMVYNKGLLRLHMIKHKQEKKFSCSYCKKVFTRKEVWMMHERIHTGDKRKVCKICKEAFVQKSSLNCHMMKYHPDSV